MSLTRKRIAEREAEIHDLPWMDRKKTTPWDLSETDKVKKLRRIIREEEPVLIIGSPCCTAFCKPHRLSEGKGVYEYQVRMTRYFLHEHPLTASSWALRSVRRVLAVGGVETAVLDQCLCGQRVQDKCGRDLLGNQRGS